MGLGGSANPLEYETVKIEHLFTFSLSEKWDRPLRRYIDSWLDICYEYADSFRIIAIGISAYCVLSGLAKLVEATKATDSSSKSRSHDKSSSSSSSSHSKDKSKEKSSKQKSSKPTSEDPKDEPANSS